MCQIALYFHGKIKLFHSIRPTKKLEYINNDSIAKLPIIVKANPTIAPTIPIIEIQNLLSLATFVAIRDIS